MKKYSLCYIYWPSKVFAGPSHKMRWPGRLFDPSMPGRWRSALAVALANRNLHCIPSWWRIGKKKHQNIGSSICDSWHNSSIHLLWVGKIIFQTFQSKNQRCHAYLGKIQYVTQVKYWQIPTTEKKLWCVSVSTVNFLRLLSWLVRFANGERHCFPGTCVSSHSSWNHETGEQQFWTCSTASRIHWSEANTFILIVPISWGTPGRFSKKFFNFNSTIFVQLQHVCMALW